MPLHHRTLLPPEYTSASGACGGSTCGVVPHRCGFRSVCHRSPLSSQAKFVCLLSFFLSLAVSAFPLLLLLLVVEKSTFYLTSPVSSEVFGTKKEEDLLDCPSLPLMEEFFVVLKLGFFWRGGRRGIGGFISTRFTTGTFASLLAVVPTGTRFVCRRSSFLV
jgi:hypothetical protein